MGAVKRDLHKQERFYEYMNLSELEVVQWLLENRDKIDKYKDIDVNRKIDEAGDIDDFNLALINIYMYLDFLINKCDFTESQLALITLLGEGYTLEDVSQYCKENNLSGGNKSQISKKFHTICKHIVEMNDHLWKVHVHNNILGTDTKKCKKCSRELPLTNAFFSKKSDSKDGFHPYCKMCR